MTQKKQRKMTVTIDVSERRAILTAKHSNGTTMSRAWKREMPGSWVGTKGEWSDKFSSEIADALEDIDSAAVSLLQAMMP